MYIIFRSIFTNGVIYSRIYSFFLFQTFCSSGKLVIMCTTIYYVVVVKGALAMLFLNPLISILIFSLLLEHPFCLLHHPLATSFGSTIINEN